jgi:hypothetical protein
MSVNIWLYWNEQARSSTRVKEGQSAHPRIVCGLLGDLGSRKRIEVKQKNGTSTQIVLAPPFDM